MGFLLRGSLSCKLLTLFPDASASENPAASERYRRAMVLQIDMSFQNVNETLHSMECAVHVFALFVDCCLGLIVLGPVDAS